MSEYIETIKQMIADGQLAQDVAEKYFPQIESEDERIRKYLIDVVNDYCKGSEHDGCIAWLEKQGEQKPAKIHRTGVSAFTDVIQAIRTVYDEESEYELIEYLKGLVNSKEQKPVEEINGEDYGIDSLWHALRILEKTLGKVEGYQSDDGILEHKAAITAVKKLYGQKPAEWSEEDKEHLESVIHRMEVIAPNPYGRIKEEIAWLKSLRPQKSFEWNDYDEKMFQLIKDVINVYGKTQGSTIANISIGELKDFLCSLRSQRDLKPHYIEGKWYTGDAEKKQLKKIVDEINRPNGCITMEDFNGGEGFYKLNLDYLNRKQVEEIETMIRVWNIKKTIGIYGNICKRYEKDGTED